MKIREYKLWLILSVPCVLLTAMVPFILALAGLSLSRWGHSPLMAIAGLSAIFYILLFIVNLRLAIGGYFFANKAFAPLSLVNYILVWQVFHAATLVTSELWETRAMKFPILILGLFFLAFVTVKVVKFYLSEQPKES